MIYYVERGIIFTGFKQLKIINTAPSSLIEQGWYFIMADNNTLGITIDLSVYKKHINNGLLNDAYDYIIYSLREEKLKNILNENY